MSQGEIRQLEKKGDVTLTEEDYLEVIRCKTAVLFQGCLQDRRPGCRRRTDPGDGP